MNKSKKTVKNRKNAYAEEFASNLILAIFSFAFLLVILLIFMYNSFNTVNGYLFAYRAAQIGGWLFAAGTVGGIAWAITDKKRNKDNSYKLVRGETLAVLSAVMSICGFVTMIFTQSGIKMLYVFVPVAAVLGLIYLIYPRDFFAVSLVSTCGGLLMWQMSKMTRSGFVFLTEPKYWDSAALYTSIAALLLLLAFVVLISSCRRKNGQLMIGKKAFPLFSKSANYSLMLLTAVINAVCVILAYLLGASAAYYLIYVVFGYLFIIAVYYTIKMM